MLAKRGTHWWLDIRVRGRRVRRSLGTPERALAIERARDITLELRNPKPPGTPIDEFAARCLDWSRETKPASYAAERYRVDIIKAWFNKAGLLTLESITPYHIEQFRAAVCARPIGKEKGRTTSRPTANRYLALVRVMFNKARDWGTFTGTNPVSKVRFYREGGKVRPLDNSEVTRVLEAADTLAARKDATPLQREAPRLFRFILQTGLRRSEALNLRWVDVGDEGIRVRGKGGKVRVVPLNATAQEILDSEKRLTQYVFDVPGRTSPSVLRRLTETICKQTGVPFHLHLLRHAFASRLLASGVDVVTIGDLLGHSSAMVSLLYTHSSEAQKRRAVDTLGYGLNMSEK